MPDELIAICDACKTPIPAGQGSLYVLYREINALESARAAIPDTPSLDWEALFALPPVPHWRMLHDACQTDRDEGSYEIAVEQISSWPKLVEWTAHLLEKRWLPSTDWGVRLRAISEGRGCLRPAREPAGSPR